MAFWGVYQASCGQISMKIGENQAGAFLDLPIQHRDVDFSGKTQFVALEIFKFCSNVTSRKTTKKSKCNFSASFADRRGIFEYRNPILKNPGTIVEIRPKVACRFFRIFSRRYARKNANNIETPLLGEFRRSSWDFRVSDSDTQKSRDDRRNSPKGGASIFFSPNSVLTQGSR